MTDSTLSIIDDAFGLLAKNTELSLGEYTAITQSQADIEYYLMQHLSTFSTVLYGAFSRKTIVSPLSDSIIDMLVIFRVSDINNGAPSQIFANLRDVLIEQYPDAYALQNKNALMLPANNYHFKIHPAYQVSDHLYMIPDENFNNWIKYDIRTYNDISTRENIRHKGRLIEIVRMIKIWNKVSGNLFNGYYLELLVTDMLSAYEIKSDAETLCYIFKYGVSKVVFQQHDPANMEVQVEGLNDINDLIDAMVLFKNSYLIAKEAIDFEKDGDIKNAIDNWNKIYPQAFPTHLDMVVGKARRTGIKGADALRMMINQTSN